MVQSFNVWWRHDCLGNVYHVVTKQDSWYAYIEYDKRKLVVWWSNLLLTWACLTAYYSPGLGSIRLLLIGIHSVSFKTQQITPEIYHSHPLAFLLETILNLKEIHFSWLNRTYHYLLVLLIQFRMFQLAYLWNLHNNILFLR